MAAPSGTSWGGIVGGYGRIGIYLSLSSSATTTTATVQVWFWSKYSIVDSGNTLYADWGTTNAYTSQGSRSINHTVASGSGWSTSNQTLLATYTGNYGRGTSNSTGYFAAKFSGIDRVGGTMSHYVSFSVPAKASYTITYNANYGTGAPGSQIKWHGTNLTLSTAKPTRTGYTFKGWATSSSGAVVYNPGDVFTNNYSITLYAVWKANTFTVSYNANGGSGAPGNQTKTYGVNLTLSSTKPTKTNYNFLGWGTSANSTTVSYKPGASYTSNSAITLYAIWELAYIAPRITNFDVHRVNSSGDASDDTGEYFYISFDYETDRPITSGYMEYKESSATEYNRLMDLSKNDTTSGHYEYVFMMMSFNSEKSWDIRVVISDGVGSNSMTGTLPPMRFTIDCLSGGNGIAFGKPATLDGVAEFGFKTRFSGGFDEIPIVENTDLNSIVTSGYYVCTHNTVAATLVNCPIEDSFVMEVFTHAGVHQRLTMYKSYDTHTYVRNFYRDVWGPWQIVMNTEILKSTTNLNTVIKPGVYYSSGGNPNTPPPVVGKGSFSIEVIPVGDSGQRMQRFTLCDKTKSLVCHRFYYQDSWGEWEIIGNGTKGLWTGGWCMTSGHIANLSEPISSQQYGIVLVWSEYANGQVYNDQWHTFFVPKDLIRSNPTIRYNCLFSGYGNMSYMASKMITIKDSQISGDDNNNRSGTNSGISYNNARYILRYVIGV